MNNWPKNLALALFSMLTLSACGTTALVQMEPQVKQLKDLQDHDSDGVIEAREQCADTILGAAVDNYGCGTHANYVEPINVDIKFAHNSYALSPSDLPKVEQLAAILKERPELDIVIEGHTSKVGSSEYNQRLSEQRAKAVATALINNFEIDPARVKAVGYGFTRLADESDTELAHQTNRRIMAELSKQVRVDHMIWTIYTVDQVD